MTKEPFSPLLFLSSLGAGGIAVIPFAFLQYTFHTGKGLVTWSHMGHGSLSPGAELFFFALEGVMILFSLAHFALTFLLFRDLYSWLRTDEYHRVLNDPLANAALITPFISVTMSMNVFIGPIRFFVPFLQENFQSLMLPATVVWGAIWMFLMFTEINLLTISFKKSFDVGKISFGWLLHPFALGMVTVTGTGIAAMAKDPSIAHTAAFFSLVSGTMGVFLLVVKLISIFKSHFAMDGLPDRQFLPSFLIVVPNITLFAISAFRFGHYLEHQFGAHLGIFFMAVIGISFAFETWYLMFGFSLLRDYFKKYFFSGEYFVSQWGFVCPLVAYAVLGSFLYNVFIASPVVYATVLLFTVLSVAVFVIVFTRQHRAVRRSATEEMGLEPV